MMQILHLPAAKSERGDGNRGENEETDFVVFLSGSDELWRVVDNGPEEGIIAGLRGLLSALLAEDVGGLCLLAHARCADP